MPHATTTAHHNLGSLQQAALIYGCHPRTVRRMIENGVLEGFRLPGSRLLRVDLDELEAKLRPIPTASSSRYAGGAA